MILTVSDQDLVVTRWRRYGKDRLYVATPDGAKVGFWDLVADIGYAESPDHEPAMLTAVTNWKAQVVHEGGGTTSTPPSGASTPPTRGTAADPAQRPVPVPPGGCDKPEPSVGLATSEVRPPINPKSTPDTDVALVPVEASNSVMTSPAPLRPWVDLAANRAGAEARVQAQAARDAAPVRTMLARVLGVHTDERAWRIGADGEERVAAQFDKVAKKDSRWRFLHAIPVGNRGSDIDHVIIGPGGVFTANAKHHPRAKIWIGGNTFLVNGIKQPYVRNARHEAQRAARLLSEACGFLVHVEGLVVTVNADDVVVKAQPEGVSVVPRMQVARWLLRHGDVHTLEAIDAIHDVARRSTTWR